MELAGIQSTTALAALMNRPGMSKGTLDRIARGTRGIKDFEAQWLAAATGVTPGFFLDEAPVPMPQAAAEESLPSVEGTLAEVLGGLRNALIEINEQLAKQTAVLEDVKGLLQQDRDTAATLAGISDTADEKVRQLGETVQQTMDRLGPALEAIRRASTPMEERTER
jgi:transcriptional regulator with XRE-family HTH domain